MGCPDCSHAQLKFQMSSLDLSPLVAEHSREICRSLGSHGGCITRQQNDGTTGARAYSLPRNSTSRATTRDDHVFFLNEVDGQYNSGTLCLWPLRAMPHPLAMFYRRLPMAIIEFIAAAFVAIDTMMSSPVPELRTSTLSKPMCCVPKTTPIGRERDNGRKQ